MPQKRKMETDDNVNDIVTRLRRGEASILEAVATELPEVWLAEIIANLNLRDTLNLAQLNKACNEAVWSPDGVSSMPEKIKVHLYSKYVEHESRYSSERVPMHIAARHGNVPAIKALLKAGVDIDAQEHCGYTALHVATFGPEEQGDEYDNRGHLNVVKFLIEAGANVNAECHSGPPLYYAAEKGDARIVMELIKAGADVNETGHNHKRGWDDTPLNRAARSGHATCVALLIQAGADVNFANEKGQTPLYEAVKRDYFEIEGLLRCAGASDDFSEVELESEDEDEDDEAVDEDEDDHDDEDENDGDEPTSAFDGVTFSQLYAYPNQQHIENWIDHM